MPIPFLSKYKHKPLSIIIKKQIIKIEKEIETTLTPSIPSLNVFTTYNIGFAIETDLQKSGRILME